MVSAFPQVRSPLPPPIKERESQAETAALLWEVTQRQSCHPRLVGALTKQLRFKSRARVVFQLEMWLWPFLGNVMCHSQPGLDLLSLITEESQLHKANKHLLNRWVNCWKSALLKLVEFVVFPFKQTTTFTIFCSAPNFVQGEKILIVGKPNKQWL